MQWTYFMNQSLKNVQLTQAETRKQPCLYCPNTENATTNWPGWTNLTTIWGIFGETSIRVSRRAGKRLFFGFVEHAIIVYSLQPVRTQISRKIPVWDRARLLGGSRQLKDLNFSSTFTRSWWCEFLRIFRILERKRQEREKASLYPKTASHFIVQINNGWSIGGRSH